MIKKVACVVLVAFAASWISALPAGASETPVAEVLTHIDADDILWVEATVEASQDGLVKINVRAPARNGGRILWQRCVLPYSGPGTYRCGIDVAKGSLAHKRLGTWKAGVSFDGTHVGHTFFSMSR